MDQRDSLPSVVTSIVRSPKRGTTQRAHYGRIARAIGSHFLIFPANPHNTVEIVRSRVNTRERVSPTPTSVACQPFRSGWTQIGLAYRKSQRPEKRRAVVWKFVSPPTFRFPAVPPSRASRFIARPSPKSTGESTPASGFLPAIDEVSEI